MVDPVLGSLTPQLVSVQSARRFYSFTFWILGQHHGSKLWDSPLSLSVRSLSRTLLSLVPRPLLSGHLFFSFLSKRTLLNTRVCSQHAPRSFLFAGHQSLF
ncbi:hypothetical protein TNCV_3178541 [Trichonephila clavipes]|nr:hypothetical protein TNCV_3178541 [Trichonephila clavipes]